MPDDVIITVSCDPALVEGMPWWIVTTANEGFHGDACVLQARSEEAAADIGLEWLTECKHADDPDITTVFVVSFENRGAYRASQVAVRANFQCCGGPHPDMAECGGHWSTCDERPAGTGQIREGEDATWPR